MRLIYSVMKFVGGALVGASVFTRGFGGNSMAGMFAILFGLSIAAFAHYDEGRSLEKTPEQ